VTWDRLLSSLGRPFFHLGAAVRSPDAGDPCGEDAEYGPESEDTQDAPTEPEDQGEGDERDGEGAGAHRGQVGELDAHQTPCRVVDRGEQGVEGEVQREVGDDADDRGCDAGQGGGDGAVAAQALDVGGAEEDEQEAGMLRTT
jgi:hypothetical protein